MGERGDEPGGHALKIRPAIDTDPQAAHRGPLKWLLHPAIFLVNAGRDNRLPSGTQVFGKLGKRPGSRFERNGKTPAGRSAPGGAIRDLEPCFAPLDGAGAP